MILKMWWFINRKKLGKDKPADSWNILAREKKKILMPFTIGI